MLTAFLHACRFPVEPHLLSVLSDRNSTFVKAVGKNCYVIRLSAWEVTRTVSSYDTASSHGNNKSFVSCSANSSKILFSRNYITYSQRLLHPKSFCFVQTAVKPVKPVGYRTVNPRPSDCDQAIRSIIHREKNYVEISVCKNLNTAFT